MAYRAAEAFALGLAVLLGTAFGDTMAQPPAEQGEPPAEPVPDPNLPAEQPQTGALAPETQPLAQPWLPRATAELQALDKIDDRSATLNVPVGQSVQFEHITITVRACVVRPPDMAADAAAFLQVVDLRAGMPKFSGWMLSAEPFLSMMEHPAFDLRVLACR